MMTILLFCISFFLFGGTAYYMQLQKNVGIIINEVCNNNFSNYSDTQGNYLNWIEIYNADDETHSLDGYQITNQKRRQNFTFDNIELEGHGYVTVFFTDEQIDDKEDGGLYADFELEFGEEVIYLSDANNRLVDMVEVPCLKVNQTYARSEDGGSDWQEQKATPLESNNNQVKYIREKNEENIVEPRFSVISGFYKDAFELTISADEKVDIYYTLDGSIPDKTSYLYDGGIWIEDASSNPNVYSMRRDTTTQFFTDEVIALPEKLLDKATVVRAVSVDEKGNCSETVTATYFVGFHGKDAYNDFAVISLVSEPENLFDYETGIYVAGKIYDGPQATDDWLWSKANYRNTGRSAEREVYMEMFDESHQLVVNKKCGIRIRGKASRAFLQKSFNLFAREEYDGCESFEYDFWNDGDGQVSEISLSSGGNDLMTRMKDYVASNVCEDLHFTTLKHRPCVVFLNGEYWGMYYITEKYNAEYINKNFGIQEENVVMIRNWKIEEGDNEDLLKLHEDMELIGSMDLTISENYMKVCELVDIDSVVDYYAFQIYVSRRGDWLGAPQEGGNWGVWKTDYVSGKPYEDGKWRWLLFDVNSSAMDDLSFDTFAYVENKSYYHVFTNLMTNPDFKKKFCERIDYLGTVALEASKMEKIIGNISNANRMQVLMTYDRYYSNSMTSETYDKSVESMRHFFVNRYEWIQNIMQGYGFCDILID